MSGRILVVGSSNVDLILRIPRFHGPGETITGESLVTSFGGKGANRAIAAKRLGGRVSFITKLGDDQYGTACRSNLIKHGFNRRGIRRDKEHPTGLALIELIPGGENRIIVSPGANGCLSPEDLQGLASFWNGIKVFVTQFEVPVPTVRKVLEMSRDHGAVTLLNPSPVTRFPLSLLSMVDFLVPNEWEAQALTGLRIKQEHDIPKIAARLVSMGASNVIITLGPKGLFFKNREVEIRMKAFRVKALDSTAAGDAFVGALACGLSENKPIGNALAFASGAGALATTKLGAQPSLPLTSELDQFLAPLEKGGKALRLR